MVLPKCVMVVIISCFELNINEINSRIRSDDKDEFHERVICRDVGGYQIQVSCCVDNGK